MPHCCVPNCRSNYNAGFQAITNWKKAELPFNSTNYHFPTKNSDKQPPLDNYNNQLTIAVNSYRPSNDKRFGEMYGSTESIPSSSSKVENNAIGRTWNVFRASELFRPRYKSLNTTCERNIYKVYSNNEKSAVFRNNYELWSDANYFSDSTNHKIRRSEPADEFSEDSRFKYDDDYFLVNYSDLWKDRNEEIADDREQTVTRGTPAKKNSKREAQDREFSVMFHSRKNHEPRDKLSNNYDFNKNGKKKSRLHSDKKKRKHEFGSQHERKMNFMDRRNNLKESYSHVERTALNPISPKKKYSIWSSKKDKVASKADHLGGEVATSPKVFSSSFVPPRKVMHWATTRGYVADISKRNLMTPVQLTTKARFVPSEFVPFFNITDSILTARKSAVVSSSPSPTPLNGAAVLMNQSGGPQYLRLGNESLDVQNLNPNLPFPLSFNIPVAKDSENNAAVYGPPVRASTPVVFFFNPATEVVNPLLNHLDTFKNTTIWNNKQGPPGSLNAFSNLASLINYQIDNPASNLSDSPVEQALPFLQPEDKTWRSVDTDLFTPLSVETKLVQDVQNDPLTVDYQAGLEVTPSPIIGAEAIVNFLQNALLNQNGALNEPQVSEASETIATSTTESINMHELPIDDNILRILDSKNYHLESVSSTRAVITKAVPLLRFFTTEEPLMNRFSDIINRNADRKIPIVYDIEEAPQLLPKGIKRNMTSVSLSHILHEMPSNRIQRHVVDRRSSVKNNKTAIASTKKDKASMKHKQVEKQTNLTTPWFFLTTTENMLYSEMKVQYQLESMNKPKAKNKNKINYLLFKSKAKPNATTSVNTVTKQMEKTAKPLSSAAPKEKTRERKAITKQQSIRSKSVTTEGTEPSIRSCCCCCRNSNRYHKGRKKGRGGCGCCSTDSGQPTLDDCTTKCTSPPLELTTKISCEPYNISVGSISCPNCHHEFTYKLGFKNLIV